MTSDELRALAKLLRLPQCPVEASMAAAKILEALAREIEE